MKAFKILGTTDDVTTCDLCGKPELKGTVVLAPLDADGAIDGDAAYYGSSCAAKAAGWTLKDIRAGVKAAKLEAQAAERAARIAARDAETKAYNAWVTETYGNGPALKAAVQAHGQAGLWSQFRAAQAAQEAVEAPVEAKPAPCTVKARGDLHLMTVHCPECNAFRMAKLPLDRVEALCHSGHFSQAEYEAYMFVWATSTVRHSAGAWSAEPTDPAVLSLAAAIRRHAGLPAPVALAA
jgi:hypothetical protein